MRNIVESGVAVLLLVLFYVVVPALTIWGWTRWIRRPKPRDFASISSLIAFILSTASALLAASSIAYAHATGGFRYYDPRLLRIFRWGFLLSLGAFLFSLGGVWRRNVLRWHALACAIGMTFFWISAAAGE